MVITDVQWLKKWFGLFLEAFRERKLGGFQAVSVGWKVNRTFARMNWSGRLSNDYEVGASSAESFVYLSRIHRMRIGGKTSPTIKIEITR
jgi:hypothetical protein